MSLASLSVTYTIQILTIVHLSRPWCILCPTNLALFTQQDLETYKQKVKEEISDWTAALKAKNIPDWLIVVMNSDENKGKTKLLPRSSVYDKIKSDFCGKHQER